MPTIHVSRSYLIDAPKEQIKKVLMHFQESTSWSPWLVIDPDAKVAFSEHQGEVGSGFSWEGELVGFVSCIPYNGDAPLPEGFIKGELLTQNAIKTIHTGSYKHLGNAWTAATTYARVKKIKTTKALMGIEFYPNDPDNTPEEELTTEIFLPLW